MWLIVCGQFDVGAPFVTGKEPGLVPQRRQVRSDYPTVGIPLRSSAAIRLPVSVQTCFSGAVSVVTSEC